MAWRSSLPNPARKARWDTLDLGFLTLDLSYSSSALFYCIYIIIIIIVIIIIIYVNIFFTMNSKFLTV